MLLDDRVPVRGHKSCSFGHARQPIEVGQLNKGGPGDVGLPGIITLVPNVLQEQARTVIDRADAYLVVPGLVSPRNAHGDVLHDCHSVSPSPIASTRSSW